jgi:predicted RND superfamily exporter protein
MFKIVLSYVLVLALVFVLIYYVYELIRYNKVQNEHERKLNDFATEVKAGNWENWTETSDKLFSSMDQVIDLSKRRVWILLLVLELMVCLLFINSSFI